MVTTDDWKLWEEELAGKLYFPSWLVCLPFLCVIMFGISIGWWVF